MGRLILLAGVLAAAPAPPVRVPGLVGYWRLDESAGPAVDDSGGGNDGAWMNGPVATASVPPAGPPGVGFPNAACLSFDGLNDLVQIGNAAALTPRSAITVAAWVNIDSKTAEKKVVAKWADSPTRDASYLLSVGGATHDVPKFAVETSAGALMSVGAVVSLNAGQWHHLAGTYDGATVRIYVDGVSRGSGPLTGALRSGAAPLRIGCGSGTTLSSEEPFDGRIDEARIYDRALSAAEISELHAGALPARPALRAKAQDRQVSLSWTSPAASHSLRRASTSGGPYAEIARLSGTSYEDAEVEEGATYFYVVAATNVVGETASAEASATLPPPPARAKDHEEGLVGERCACGTLSPQGFPGAALAAFAAAVAAAFALRR